MDTNCRPLEHFNFIFFPRWTVSWKHAQTEPTVFIRPPHVPAPSPLYSSSSSSSSSLSCFIRVKGKGSENNATSRRTQSPSRALTFKARGTHDWLHNWDVAYSHIFVLFVVIWYIIFCLYKTGPRKQHNTSPHFYLFYFSYQNLGRRNYICAQLLVQIPFDTVGY